MATHRKRSLVILTVIILVVAIVLSSFVYLNFQKPNNGNVESVSIGLEPNQVSSLVYVAQNQGYFSKNGLNVALNNYSSGAAALTGMQNGEVNIAMTGEFVFARNILSNYSIETIGTVSRYSISYVMANKENGVNNISDLVGKKIGMTFQTSSQFNIGRFLELNGIALSQVSLVNIPPDQLGNALANGTVDAVVAWQPYVYAIQNQLGNSLVMWDAQSGQQSFECIVSTSNWVSNHPQAAKKLLTALVQAEDYLIDHPSEGKTILQNSLNLTAQYVENTWSNYNFAVSLDQSLLLTMQDEARWLISNNQTNATAIPNFLNYVYLDGLESVKPDSITIIK